MRRKREREMEKRGDRAGGRHMKLQKENWIFRRREGDLIIL